MQFASDTTAFLILQSQQSAGERMQRLVHRSNFSPGSTALAHVTDDGCDPGPFPGNKPRKRDLQREHSPATVLPPEFHNRPRRGLDSGLWLPGGAVARWEVRF